jgi:hypothetical protein
MRHRMRGFEQVVRDRRSGAYTHPRLHYILYNISLITTSCSLCSLYLGLSFHFPSAVLVHSRGVNADPPPPVSASSAARAMCARDAARAASPLVCFPGSSATHGSVT